MNLIGCRNVQEGKGQLGNDYSLQHQPGGGSGGGSFLDQTQMLFNPGGRKDFIVHTYITTVFQSQTSQKLETLLFSFSL